MAKRRSRHALPALLMLLVQVGALLNLTRIPAEILPQLSLFLPLELVLTLAWALIFAWLAVNLWRGLPTRWLWQALLLYVVISVLRLLFFARADYVQGRMPILLLVLYRYRTASQRKPGT